MRKLLPIIFIILIIGSLAWIYLFFKDRDTKVLRSDISQNITTENSKQSDQSNPEDQSSNTPEPETTKTENEINQNTKNTTPTTNNAKPFLQITPDICNNDCNKFKKNKSQFTYCQQVCGMTTSTNINNEGECYNKTNLEKDYCFKDLAIQKNDLSICDNVKDVNLKTSCQNRVNENLFESQRPPLSEQPL